MKSVILLALSVLSFSLHAQTIGGLTYGGTGCPNGSLKYSFDRSQKNLVLNYTKFSVRSGSGTNKTLDRKACSVALPIQVPAGYQLALATESDGYALVRNNGRATINLEAFYAGTTGIKNSKVYRPGQHAVSIGDSINTLAWSPCGQATNLRMNLSAVTQRDASLILRQLNLKLLLRSCQ